MPAKTPLAVPGKPLASAEEYLPEKNAFEDGEHIRAAVVGRPRFDPRAHTLSVEGKRTVALMQEGDTVLARVAYRKKNMVVVEILAAESPSGEPRVVHKRKAAVLVHEISQAYVEKLSDAYRVGDFLRGRISELRPYGVNIRTNEPGLGVVKAFCARCRHPLSLAHQTLVCTACGAREQRALSNRYLLSHEVEPHGPPSA